MLGAVLSVISIYLIYYFLLKYFSPFLDKVIDKLYKITKKNTLE